MARIKRSAMRVAKSLEAHRLVAIVFGALLYILAATGTLSVFNHELQRWEQPNVPEMVSIAPEAAERAALSVLESEEVPTTHLYVNFPQEDLPRTVITTDTQAFFAAPDGTIAGPEKFPWTQFLLDLHYYLHLPQTLGLTVVGALGAMLIALSFSGLLAHPRIFRDAFTFRHGAGRLTTIDLHNRLSVWTLPFHFSNALTGSILGLASVLALAIAAVGFDGDTGAVFDPVFGAEPEPIEGQAAMASIAEPLAFMAREFPELDVTYFILHDPGTAGQHSSVIAEHSDRLIFGDYYNFTSEGEYQGNVGISDGTIGQQVTGAVYNVHFGNWGGLPVKLAYLGFGLGLCVIIASGLSIYFSKRVANGRPAPRLAGAWQGVVWGTPAMLAVTLGSSFLGLEGAGLVTAFWLGLAMLIFLSGLAGSSRAKKAVQALTALALLLALFAYSLRYGSAVLSDAGLGVSTVAMLLVVALATAVIRSSGKVGHRKSGQAEWVGQPAE
ncbi:MAG: PepSY domain-containing protein [Erythrobacter sp.]|uniref:PepSY-associated TM helix domain-containing protein n=1 Tax=Erythrobacter sp. TaxID=1042 RepID=UPI001B262936|nr:PepSY-associated TM helix domain-containing protein [Erythrobacter sp.]MBO6769093.1 PepSY domain-containing protein [Erythrobacter sp.]